MTRYELREMIASIVGAQPTQRGLSVVRESDTPATTAPESTYRSDLRRRIVGISSSLSDAAKLAAIGTVLADGALEIRPCMSAKAAKSWVQSHVDDIGRAHLDVVGGAFPGEYVKMRDLRDAVLGAAAELDEAAHDAKSPNLVAAIYNVIGQEMPSPINPWQGALRNQAPWWMYALAGVGVVGLGYVGWRVLGRTNITKRHR